MAFGTFVIPDFSGAFYQNSLLVQAQGQLVLTVFMLSQITHFVNDFNLLMGKRRIPLNLLIDINHPGAYDGIEKLRRKWHDCSARRFAWFPEIFIFPG